MMVLAIVAVTVFVPKATFAQGIDNNVNGGTDNTIYNPDTGATTGQTGGTTTGSSFDWRWLLPILALPVLYIAYKAMTNNDRERSNPQLAGEKGGEAKKYRESQDLDEDHDIDT